MQSFQFSDVKTKIIAGLAIVIAGFIVKKSVTYALRAMNRNLCEKIFGKSMVKFDKTFKLTEENIEKTKLYIKNYGSIIRILLRFLLFLRHTSTQHSYADYIHNACKLKKCKETESIMLFLLDSGIDPRYVKIPKDNYLITQLCHNNDPDSTEFLKELLLNRKVDPNHRDRKYKVKSFGSDMSYRAPTIENATDPLPVACYYNNTQAIELLLLSGTNTHPFVDCDPMKTPPILRAIEQKNAKMFKALLKYALFKSCPVSMTYKIWQLKQIIENRDLQKVITHNFIDLSIANPNHSLLNECFTCDEKIWLPHPPTTYAPARTFPPRRITKETYQSYDKWKNDLKTQIQEFLPRLQISS